jgi:hypothetical protein
MTDEEFLAQMTRSKLRGLSHGVGDLIEISLSTGDGKYVTKRFSRKQIQEEYNRRPEPQKQPIRR